MLNLGTFGTALVLIDLEEGILPLASRQYSTAGDVKRAVVLAQGFRDAHARVFLLCVDWSADFADALKQPVDTGTGGPLPANWWNIPAALQAQDNDILGIKCQLGAFCGTDLEVQLCRCGI